MRIISGNLRGKKILSPLDKSTRPLKDMVRESIFNIIEHSKKETVASAETIADAATWSRDAVNTSQGEYSMFNRPEISRGNLFSYLMVYKQFMIISVELMSNMPRKQKLAFLGMLFFGYHLINQHQYYQVNGWLAFQSFF